MNCNTVRFCEKVIKERKIFVPEKTVSMKNLEVIRQHAPDWVNQEKYDTNGVWYAMPCCKGVPEAAWCFDVLLEQVAANYQTNKYTDNIMS